MIRLGFLVTTLTTLGLVAESAAQQPDTGVWGRGPHKSVAEWQALVISWFEDTFSAASRLVLVQDEATLNGIRNARGGKASSALALELASQAAPCKVAIRYPCVSSREAILRLDSLKPAASAEAEPRWHTGFWVVWMENEVRMARPYSVLLEGERDGPVKVVWAMTRSH
jgi:hypothetical protein